MRYEGRTSYATPGAAQTVIDAVFKALSANPGEAKYTRTSATAFTITGVAVTVGEGKDQVIAPATCNVSAENVGNGECELTVGFGAELDAFPEAHFPIAINVITSGSLQLCDTMLTMAEQALGGAEPPAAGEQGVA